MNQLEKLDLIHALAHKQKRVEFFDEGIWQEAIIDNEGDVHVVTNRPLDGDMVPWGDIDVLFPFELRELYEPFKPKLGQMFWYWKSDDATGCYAWSFHIVDLLNYAFGNCFRSEEECLAHPEIKEKLEAIRKELE